MSAPDAPTLYIRLALTIEKVFTGYVDAYFGPPLIRESVEADDDPSIGHLEALANTLQDSLEADANLSPERREFLLTQLRAMRMTIRILHGDKPDLVDEVQDLYGVTPLWIDERTFHDAHSALNDILPGSEPLSRRVVDFQARSRVSSEVAQTVLAHLVTDLRQRTRHQFPLPSQEDCVTTFVRNEPWYAYNRYLGNLRSLIDINQDVALEIWDLPNLVAHELYPGHHTEFSIKEELLYRQGNRLEHSILLSNAPSALVSEGIATNALQVIASPDEITSMLLQCYEIAGLPASDAARALDFIIATRPLRRVTDNQAFLLLRDQVSEEEVVSYGMRYGLKDETQARQELRSLQDPLWRSYGFNYTVGRDLVDAFLNSSTDKAQTFTRLLSEPLTPSHIQRAIAMSSSTTC